MFSSSTSPRHLLWAASFVAAFFFTTTMSRYIDAAGPLPPAGTQKSFVTAEPLSIELVASEPTVIDPVDIAFDEHGRLWVAEMRDYPNGPQGDARPISQIKILRDLDGDGVYEKATTFVDNLLFVTGLLPWKDGVIVTVAGQVVWMADSDGDDQIDQREVWLEGFAEQNPQLRANHPTLGADGWIYVANGLRGGEVNVVHPDWPKLDKPISLRGKDFRFHPRTGQCEAIAGNGQFGMSFDAWGNRLICSNRNPSMQVMFQFGDLASQPLLIVPSLINDISPAGPDSKLFPLTGAWTTSNLHAGQFSAACGVHSYQGTALPASFANAIFTCEPTANLIHGDRIKVDGATFSAVQPHQPKEFLASTDDWFRPVNLKTGPDGAMYVVDMYRAVIEHPQFMPEELKTRPDLVLGNDRGRIWRIAAQPRGKSGQSVTTVPQQWDAPTLLAWLAHSNVWQRETAARIISCDADANTIAQLQASLKTDLSSATAALTLSLLAQHNALSAADLLTACGHTDPVVRQRAVELAGRASTGQLKLIGDQDATAIGTAIKNAMADEHPHVRFAALIAGRDQLDGLADAPEILTEAVLKDSTRVDPWLQKASLLGINQALPGLLGEICRFETTGEKSAEKAATDYAFTVSQLIGRLNDAGQIQQSLVFLWDNSDNEISLPLETAIVRGLGTGLRSRGQSLSRVLIAKAGNNIAWTKQAAYQKFLERLLTELESSEDLMVQLDAIETLRHLPDESISGLLVEIARDRQAPGNLRTASLDALAGRPIANAAAIQSEFVDMVRSEAPQMRRELIDFCLSDTSATQLLLKTMASGHLNYRELANDQVTRLSRHADAEVKALHASLRAQLKDTNREQVVADYLAALKGVELTEEQAYRGRVVFRQQCATCHKIGDEGVMVAPDISDTRTKRPDDLLVNILDPNKAIDNNYFSYTAVTIDGKVHTGVLAEETPYAITLKQAKGESKTLQRDEIEEFASDGVSFMPVGLEKNITPEQMVDLISFLKNWRYIDGRVPLN